MSKKPATKAEKAYMGKVGELNCVACGSFPVHVHHLRGQKRNNYLVVPLCPDCHTGAFSIHMDRKAFEAVYCSELFLLAKTIERLHCGG